MPDEKQDEKPPAPLSVANLATAAKQTQPIFDAVWMLVGGVGMGLVAGYGLDHWLHLTPWGLVGGAVLGIIAGFIGFFQRISKLGKP